MADIRRYPEFVPPLSPSNLPVHRCTVPREQASRRILIQRNGAHGDILMGTPLLTAIRAQWPDAHLTWLVERKERESIDAHPCIDELLLWNSAYWKRLLRRGLLPLWTAAALRMRRALRERHFDVFISFQPEEWPLLARNVGAPVRIGVFDTFREFTGDSRTSSNVRFYTRAFTYGELPPHRTDQYLLPLEALGLTASGDKQMTLGFTQDDADAAARFLVGNGIRADAGFVVLAPMTTWPTRCWPGERYAALADRLADDGVPVVLIGSPREREKISAVQAAMRRCRPAVAAGDLTFRQMGALVARAAALVSGDTGPMHVAAAVRTPYVALFGPTPAPGRAPLAGRGRILLHPVPCGPCDKKRCANVGEDFMRCMRLITVEEAHTAVLDLLRGAAVPEGAAG